ncbi:MAG: hypothetical protein ACI83B_002859 [Sediminicola sp.]|jgi:hypothetical protein|tara:strand:- start:838 stop:1113 length:276 start_codon:yes stop_codon:yes gene_type:complete
MNKSLLQSKIKSKDIAYLFWFILGSHYAYFGKWRLQFLFWITLGGIGIWALMDLFFMSNKVDSVNAPIFTALEKLEKQQSIKRVKQMEMKD